ncbi:hypothetical protein QL285_034691 [Trifolium repens]|nr:hypothetical protein QL285_034691 [Trifolium repens]
MWDLFTHTCHNNLPLKCEMDMLPFKRKLSHPQTLVLIPPLPQRLSIQGVGRTFRRTIGSDTTVGSPRGGSHEGSSTLGLRTTSQISWTPHFNPKP